MSDVVVVASTNRNLKESDHLHFSCITSPPDLHERNNETRVENGLGRIEQNDRHTHKQSSQQTRIKRVDNLGPRNRVPTENAPGTSREHFDPSSERRHRSTKAIRVEIHRLSTVEFCLAEYPANVPIDTRRCFSPLDPNWARRRRSTRSESGATPRHTHSRRVCSEDACAPAVIFVPCRSVTGP